MCVAFAQAFSDGLGLKLLWYACGWAASGQEWRCVGEIDNDAFNFTSTNTFTSPAVDACALCDLANPHSIITLS